LSKTLKKNTIFVLYMLIIDVKKDGIEKALKTLKSKVIKTKQNQFLYDRKEFIKKSAKRRQEKLKASYIQKIKSELN
jgi:small subunit ribosomal protein S21